MADQPLLDSQQMEQLACYPRILAGDGSHAAEHVQSARGDISKIANRRRDNVEARL